MRGKTMTKFLLITALLISKTATATTLVLEPGKPMQVIEPTSNGYLLMDMGGHGNTLVQNVGNMEIIHSGNAPATVILHDQGDAAPTPYNLIDMIGEE
jgi:hypothetical protein